MCVRYRYDEARMERLKTVEIVIERVEWKALQRSAPSAEVRIRIEEQEDLLRRAVLFADGKWDERTNTWMLERRAAIALGLSARILRHLPKAAGRPKRSPRLDRDTDTHRRSDSTTGGPVDPDVDRIRAG